MAYLIFQINLEIILLEHFLEQLVASAHCVEREREQTALDYSLVKTYNFSLHVLKSFGA